MFLTFYYMLTSGSLHHGDMNDIIYDADAACEGRYGCMQGLIWVHTRTDMGPGEQAVMGLESQAVSARATKHFVTVFSKTCNKM